VVVDSVALMMLMTECPVFPQSIPVAPGCTTLDGQVLENLLDERPGPWLAVLLAEVDPAKLTSLELPGYLQAWQTLANWAEANLTAGVAELARRPDVHIPDKEVALALCEPAGSASRRVWAALAVTGRLPKIWRAFRAGRLTRKHVEEFVKATARVTDPDVLDAAQDRVLARAGGKTPDELRRHARDVINKLDPAGAQQRATDARATADVVMYPADDDGMADVVATQPVEDAAIVTAATHAYAANRKNAGDDRPVGVLRAEGLTRMASAYLAGKTTLGSEPTSGGRPIEIGITCSLQTALGIADLPGEVPGKGIVPRAVIADMVARERPKLRLMVIDDKTGRLLYRATTAYRPTPDQIAHVRASYVHSASPGSKVPVERCQIDHAIAHPHGDTVIGNLAPLDQNWHQDKTRKLLKVTINDTGTITVTTPLGQTRTVEPYDYRACEQPTPSSPDVENPDDNPPPF